MPTIKGHISQIIGPVVDVHFDLKGQQEEKYLPGIHEALRVMRPDGRELIIEVQQHIGEDSVRCVAMDSTDGLKRGLEAVCLGTPITMPGTVPSGPATGRNVVPGMTKAPQPTLQPNASAHAPRGEM